MTGIPHRRERITYTTKFGIITVIIHQITHLFIKSIIDYIKKNDTIIGGITILGVVKDV